MLANPWGVEQDSYLHDVGMLDEVIDMYETFDKTTTVSLHLKH